MSLPEFFRWLEEETDYGDWDDKLKRKVEERLRHSVLILDVLKAKALYRVLEHEWISRDDREAQEVVDKISQFVKEHQ